MSIQNNLFRCINILYYFLSPMQENRPKYRINYINICDKKTCFGGFEGNLMIVVLAFIFLIACYRWGAWRNWKTYYPTILFFISGDFIYLYLFSVKPLWQYTAKMMPGTITTLIVALIIYPCTVLLFLPNYPRSGLFKKIRFVSFWVLLFSGLEYLGLKYNFMQHFHGWNFICSVVFDCILFPLLVIHQKKPYIAWFLAFIFCVGVLFLFQVPAKY
ncbi:hypothetical protein Sgly_1772 [Syntrophobotulus glycolicus DSM 8271]|uniref:Uncharacterized protein n=1 Tax=Syntrophobotulus glycolicus (strain DSM 8271 / FlGlyR) TaxID=645991 RepID=F0SZI3_SYNGF|nr:CBO0543 family protein [Syntrophobotulus glycolicus]ADY56069.1 hypothetical protein Sgly_1772 [Syntrophobotulus glycolicus DSM 8271]